MKLCYNLIKLYSLGVSSVIINRDMFIININKENLLSFLNFLKNNYYLKVSQVLDIWGVDYVTKSNRFEVNYLLLSVKYNIRFIVKVSVSENGSLPSIMSLFPSAGWLEREVWDMYGVYFTNHKDLRRILTDYGFEGFPLRKDFPLSGFVEVRYDDGEKRVVLEPLEITQEYRYFHFLSPWEYKKLT